MKEQCYILTTNDLQIGYQGKVLCSSINVQLPPAKMVALMGVNGSGKSTFMRTLTGLSKSLTGTVKIEGKEIQKYSREDLSRLLAVVLTDHINAPEMTVKELVGYGRYPHTGWFGRLRIEDLKIVKEALDLVGMTEFESRHLYTLSDGELQRTLIARAIAQETKLIFLDEPASHLDIPNKAMIINLLKRLTVEKGITIIYSSHDMGMVKKYADLIWLFDENGNLQEIDFQQGVESGIFERTFGEAYQES
ncbi:MAG: ABC transporter ATP-binding protein [Bacteroidales bacterium]|nr:ABC transporter ATP-binding protein [Bacteroidales bacterium]